MTDSQSGEQTRLQRFWLSETTLVKARSQAVLSVFLAVVYSWLSWRGSSVSPVFLFTVTALAIVFTGISVVSWAKRRKHNRLTVG